MAKIINFPDKNVPAGINKDLKPNWDDSEMETIPTEYMDVYLSCREEIDQGMQFLHKMMEDGSLSLVS